MGKCVEEILKKENISYKTIKKSDSGFTNLVYFVDDKYVLKLIAPYSKPEKIKKEIEFYKNVSLPFIPKFVASGEIEGQDYLIVEKLRGESLYSVWHKLGEAQRADVVRQIAEILKAFHKTCYVFLQEKFVVTDLIEKWNKSFDLNILIIKKKGYDASALETFKDKYLKVIFEENKPGLIYNDAHFDNFLFDGEKVFLIDFDRVLYTSIDYELLIIALMCNEPKKFTIHKLESLVSKEDYKCVLQDLQKHYPELFDFEYLKERLYVYTFIYKLGHCYEFHDNQTLENLLAGFDEFVAGIKI